jgi:hypothetical protein
MRRMERGRGVCGRVWRHRLPSQATCGEVACDETHGAVAQTLAVGGLWPVPLWPIWPALWSISYSTPVMAHCTGASRTPHTPGGARMMPSTCGQRVAPASCTPHTPGPRSAAGRGGPSNGRGGPWNGGDGWNGGGGDGWSGGGRGAARGRGAGERTGGRGEARGPAAAAGGRGSGRGAARPAGGGVSRGAAGGGGGEFGGAF